MNSNNSIIKSAGSAGVNSIESRLRKLEQIFHSLMQITGNNPQNNTANTGNGLQSLMSILPQISPNSKNTQSGKGQITINPSGNFGSIPNSASKQLSISQGQFIAELAAAIMKANQRNT